MIRASFLIAALWALAGLPGCTEVPRYDGPSRALRGCVQSEARSLTKEGLTEPTFVPAAGLFVIVRRGEAVVGEGVTDKSGCFEVPITPDRGALSAEVRTVARDPNGSRWGLGVSSQDDWSPTAPATYWRWTTDGDEGCGAPAVAGTYEKSEVAELGDWLLTQRCGSGAVAVFTTVRAAMHHFDPTISPVDGAAGPSLAVQWSPNVTGYCTACFLGGPTDSITIEGDYYDAVIRLSGREDTPMHSAPSVIAHEVGHWAKRAYANVRSVQGQHSFTAPAAPELAFEEGFATAFGQRVVGAMKGAAFDPLYLSMRHYGVGWVDLRSLDSSFGGVARPVQTGGATQPISEFVVAAALGRIWVQDSALGTPALGLGDQGMRQVLESERLRGRVDRGALGIDLIDFLDAIICSGQAPRESLAQVVAPLGIPWDELARCK